MFEARHAYDAELGARGIEYPIITDEGGSVCRRDRGSGRRRANLEYDDSLAALQRTSRNRGELDGVAHHFEEHRNGLYLRLRNQIIETICARDVRLVARCDDVSHADSGLIRELRELRGGRAARRDDRQRSRRLRQGNRNRS